MNADELPKKIDNLISEVDQHKPAKPISDIPLLLTGEQTRRYIREEIARQLRNPPGVMDGKDYIRLTWTDSKGRAFKGTLYRVEE